MYGDDFFDIVFRFLGRLFFTTLFICLPVLPWVTIAYMIQEEVIQKEQEEKQKKPKTAVVRLPQGSVIELPDGQKLNGVEFVSKELSK